MEVQIDHGQILSNVPWSPKKTKTSEFSSGNETLDRNPDDDQQYEWKKNCGERKEIIITWASHSEKTKRERKMPQAKTKHTGKKEADSASHSLEFRSHTQEELKEIFGKRCTSDSEESESSEEEEGITEEELEKTKGMKLLEEALEAKFVKKPSAKT